MSRFFIAGIAFVLAGCSSILGSDEPELSVGLSSEIAIPAGHIFRVVVSGETHNLVLSGPDNTINTSAPRTGALDVTAALINGQNQSLAQASFRQTFNEKDLHWVTARVGQHRPIGHCIGALIAVPIVPALSATRSDTLFIMYGSIPRDAVC